MTTTLVSIKNSGKEYTNILAAQTGNTAKIALSFRFADVDVEITLDATNHLEGEFKSPRDHGTYQAALKFIGALHEGFHKVVYEGSWRNSEGKSGDFGLEWHRQEMASHKRSQEQAGLTDPFSLLRTSRAKMTHSHLFEPGQEEAAHRHLREYGFVALSGQIDAGMLAELNRMVLEIIRKRKLDANPKRGNRGYGRHELGRLTGMPGVLTLVDRPGVDKLLSIYWGSRDYRLQLINGIISFKGSGQQGQHIDPAKERDHLRMDTAPALKIYFNLVEFNERTGPTRFVPGSHKDTMTGKFPNGSWAKSALAYAPAGSAIVMDMRTWHAGTACKTDDPRPIIGLHFCEPGFNAGRSKVWWAYDKGAVDKETYRTLSPRAQELCEHVAKR